ncbi:hypothetical protein A2U01_0069181 [Trifolium medium]|uniref:Uncharacterized protein n=1 Tax=Trifolium medium TaxID=97028 RepID=A0A392SH12_9FABA|nr:hypothetical protein [Trifolium medium]
MQFQELNSDQRKDLLKIKVLAKRDKTEIFSVPGEQKREHSLSDAKREIASKGQLVATWEQTNLYTKDLSLSETFFA